MLLGLGVMATIATRDPGFALERDYYQKAVHYDREIEQRAANAKLAWTLVTELSPSDRAGAYALVVRPRHAAGPLVGAIVQVEALRNASASNPIEATLVERSPGEYAATLPLRAGGLWEFRLAVEHRGARFTSVERRDVTEDLP
jgi:hypothetical protein